VSDISSLERRLREEPGNLGLRVSLAGALHAAGRTGDAVELYRSVAIAYREQGRTLQAVAVCKSILEIAPDDQISRSLLATMGDGDRPSASFAGATPLPAPLPYHVADPTTRVLRKPSEPQLTPDPDAAKTQPVMQLVVDDDDDDGPITLGDPIEPVEPPTIPTSDERWVLRDTDRDVTNANQVPQAPITQAILAGALFATIPATHRATVLARFRRQSVAAGAVVIRIGETDHPLVVVGRGELAVRIEREDGRLLTVHEVVAGDHAGEGSLLSRSPAMAHVVAATACELLLLAPHDFYEIAGAFPALWTRLKDIAEKRAKERTALIRAST
jgi:hypothetical protein